ncbi:response regulator transcription factor [Sphingobacterium lactis]|uniref:DNA-binding response regulator, OmpR family, contains REC and winged-helix (WHTH) domain n=1 Tax=Sphingobacterium lactis TaxID=797291 RepID=A0A1H6BIZ8_9SPHI|nr:response regulator transcription factor [Sphingobacterium lactis]SEG60728.1 DNA-binding response regulator, OmpR family, contains REC and winged-helix (wHTH) domain [Sphingobacterium lactis]
MKILIIEDEEALRQNLEEFLTAEQFVVESAPDYDAALDKVMNYDYDCILLDIMLPGGNGLDLLRSLKEAHKKQPVLILSAKDSVEDKVLGLEIGADDYLAKPYHLSELLARIKSIIRRNSRDGEQLITYKNVSLNPDSRQVYVNGQEIVLNRKEFDLFYYFMIRPNKLMEKTTLVESVWGDHSDQADNLDFLYSQIKNVRKKLKEADAQMDIQAVYGVGYKLV